MSRSNPSQNTPHPCSRWHEWNGESGNIRWFNKESKENVTVTLPFTFMVLDRLATVKGWHDASDSGIYANEVRDTTREPLVVKAFKGGQLAQGFYREIKDRVGNMGGYYVANIYLAYKELDVLHIGSIQFKGSALRAWMEFEKENRSEIWEQAVQITGSVEGKKGKVVFKTPTFKIAKLSKESDEAAKALDVELQKYLEGYLKRNVKEQTTEAQPDAKEEPQPDPEPEPQQEPLDDENIPF